jgi:TPR repeat protein
VRAGETAPPDAVAQDAYVLLGKIYSGFPVRGTWAITAPIDDAEAIKWYRLCALELVPFCEWQLGRLLIRSPELAAEGVKWLLNAAYAGYEYPMSDLAELYEAGTVLERDLEKAVMWHQRSARWGVTVSGRADFEAAARKKVAELSKQLAPEQLARTMEAAEQFKPSTPGWH